MNSLTKSMGGVVKGMDKVLGSMDVSKVRISWWCLHRGKPHPHLAPVQISVMMDKFEKQFDDLDVRSAYMEGAMGEATSTSTPQSEVDSLVGQVAAKAGLDLGDQLASAGAVGTNVAAAAPAAAGRTAVGVGAAPTATGGGGGGGVADDLAARLANLKK